MERHRLAIGSPSARPRLAIGSPAPYFSRRNAQDAG
jgi:hypothetical protein